MKQHIILRHERSVCDHLQTRPNESRGLWRDYNQQILFWSPIELLRPTLMYLFHSLELHRRSPLLLSSTPELVPSLFQLFSLFSGCTGAWISFHVPWLSFNLISNSFHSWPTARPLQILLAHPSGQHQSLPQRRTPLSLLTFLVSPLMLPFSSARCAPRKQPGSLRTESPLGPMQGVWLLSGFHGKNVRYKCEWYIVSLCYYWGVLRYVEIVQCAGWSEDGTSQVPTSQDCKKCLKSCPMRGQS